MLVYVNVLQARFLAFNPAEYRDHAALSIELFGCHHAELDGNNTITEVYSDIEVHGPLIFMLDCVVEHGEIYLSCHTRNTVLSKT